MKKLRKSSLSLSSNTTTFIIKRWIVVFGTAFIIICHCLYNDRDNSSNNNGLLTRILPLLPTVNALKHHVRIKNGYNLIGPLGEPFSFLEKGHYEINLYDYFMYNKQSLIAKYRGNTNAKAFDTTNLNNYNGGFYLQRFTNEGEYNDYMNMLRSNRSLCSYEYFLDNTDDTIDTIDDEFDNSGIEQPSATNGILLNVKSDHFTKKAASSLSTPEMFQHVTTTIHYTFKKGEEGLYFLIYQVCPYNPDILSSFHIDFHFYNYDAFGNKSYLSAGEVHLPVMYFFFTVSYSICFAIWFLNLLEILRGRDGLFIPKATVGRQASLSSTERPVIYTIHYLMALLLIVKILSVFFEGVRYYKIQVTGHAEVLSVMYYIFTFIKGMFLFTVLLLIGTGWSFIKSSLNPRDKKIITIVLVLQCINNITITITSQETIGEKWYGRWTAVMHLIDIICCCAIIVPIVWQVDDLEKSVGITSEYDENGNTTIVHTNTRSESTIAAAAEVGEKELALERLRTFRLFYMLVIAYVYSTRILVYLFVSILNYKHIWIQQLVIELVTLTFYVTVGFMFRPKPDPTSSRSISTNGTIRSNNNNNDEEEVELISHK